MIVNDYFQVAAYQGKIIEGNQNQSLEKTLQIMHVADQRKIDILCMPESYLHGYFDNRESALANSLDLQSSEFAKLCEQFKPFSATTLLLGLNERDGDKLFNTVVIIEQGKCIGKYRKAYTYVPYEYFSLGREFPVFEKRGVKYGVIICLDSAYREPAQITALNGARLLFCPCFNRVEETAHLLNYIQRKSHFIARAFDNQCWFVSSDIVQDSDDGEVSPGYSCILSNKGEIVATAEPFYETLLSYSIPIKNLLDANPVRLLGTPDLFEIVNNSYKNATKNQ